MSTAQKCSACGFNNDPFAKECAKCKMPLGSTQSFPIMENSSNEPSIACPSCAFENELAAQICVMCGADLATAKAAVNPSGGTKTYTKAALMKSSLPKLCAQCNWKNDYESETCANCGAKLPKYLSTSDRHPAIKSRWPIWILWVAFLALIGSGVYIVVTKIILPAGRTSRSIKVQSVLRNFTLLAREFAGDHAGQYWENGNFPFGTDKIRYDYKFYYFGGDANDDGIDSSGSYVFLAVPMDISKGDNIFLVDESGLLAFAPVTSRIRLDNICSISFDDIDWSLGAASVNPSRCDFKGVVFSRLKAAP